MGETCPICKKPSNSFCANCKKVVYCGKDHQKEHRKVHKGECYPAVLRNHPVLGNHLAATRDISAGERVFKEEPLIVGPRSNLSHFHRICLGCCDQIDDKNPFTCSKCRWPLCNDKCEQNPRHALFECPILAEGSVPPASTQEEYLCITFLRCVLLEKVDPQKWEELMRFESHVETRKARPICVEQSHFTIHFIRERCRLKYIDPKVIDFIYGIIIVNGYGDPSTFAVKLYSKSAKLSHACIPNTRTILGNAKEGLEICATIPLKGGQPLTQLYGRMFKGTHRRQELLQNIYYFSCSCGRCTDPTELGTHFSAVKCHGGKKCGGFLLPKNPLDITPTSKWKCGECNNSISFIRCVVPALAEINREAGTEENDGLYSKYEIYDYDNPDVPSEGDYATEAKLQHVWKMLAVLKKLEKETVHPNHYALLPLKTALIATIHVLLLRKELDQQIKKELLDDFLRMVKELLQVVDVLLPGMTSERGLLLFYLSEGLKFSMVNISQSTVRNEMEKQLKQLQDESVKIMMLEPEDDDQRKLVLQHIKQTN